MEELTVSKYRVSELTPKTYKQWITEIKGHAGDVWKYIDPDSIRLIPNMPEYPEIGDYGTVVTPATGTAAATMNTCETWGDLDPDQKEDYRIRLATFTHRGQEVTRIKQDVKKIRTLIVESARKLIPDSKLADGPRELVKALQTRYKRDDDALIEAIHAKYEKLKETPYKPKIEDWISSWENLRDEMATYGVAGAFTEKRMATDFLKAGSSWAPNFCNMWILSKEAAGLPIVFTDTTTRYRDAVDNEKVSFGGRFRGHAHANATFQGEQLGPQSQEPQPQPQQRDEKELDKLRKKFKNHKCVCGEVHIFNDCGYIVKAARKRAWKENPKIIALIIQNILQNYANYRTISKICDTGIIDNITDDSFPDSAKLRPPQLRNQDLKPKAQDERNQGRNTFDTIGAITLSNEQNHPRYTNALYFSVVHDSGSPRTITWDRDRFVSPLEPADEWVGTAGTDLIHIIGYGTIMVYAKYGDETAPIRIANCAYAPDASGTLISSGNLRKNGVIRCEWTDTLQVKATKQKICDMPELFGLPVLEYNQSPYYNTPGSMVNSVQLHRQNEASSGIWHQRLGHCRPAVIDQLKKIPDVIVTAEGKVPRTGECDACALSKMHTINHRVSTSRATKPFQTLHFDLTILEKGIAWDGTQCIAHFTCEASSYNWVFPCQNHNESTLITIFKHMINLCDRRGMPIGAILGHIRSGRETSIGKKLENLVLSYGIEWDWSSVDTPEQNGKAERHGALLSEKARLIRLGAKLPEDMAPECYLAAGYLLNHTPAEHLSWDSPTVFIQKALGKPIRHELSHLRVFGCKAFPLLKGPQAPKKGDKLAPRAFIGYLIGYDSTNGYRIWNPERYDVKGYRDVIFDETQFFDTYKKNDIIREPERLVDVYTVEPAIPKITPNIDAFLERPVRARLQDTQNQPTDPEESQDIVEEVENLNIQDQNTYLSPPSMASPLPTMGETPLGLEQPITHSEQPSRRPRPRTEGIDTSNIIERPRTRRPKLTDEEKLKIPSGFASFAYAFIAGAHRIPEQTPDDRPPPPNNWREMLKHPNRAQYEEAAEIEIKAIQSKGTWVVVDKKKDVKYIPLMWRFTDKYDEGAKWVKAKARVVVRGDLQDTSAQDVYAATLAFKVFRTLMAMCAAGGFRTRQLDAINAFLNAWNKKPVHCHLPDGYKKRYGKNKALIVLKALYGQRTSPLEWLRELSMKCTELGLQQVPGEPCLFTDYTGIVLFFYVDDIVIIFRLNRQQDAEAFITSLKEFFAFHDKGSIKFFLGVRVIQNLDTGTVSLVQDSYIIKMIKEYNIDVSGKLLKTPLPYGELMAYEGEPNEYRITLYRQKVGSVCYPATITRADNAKAASKLAEFLINPGPEHLEAVDHNMRYLYGTRNHGIQYSSLGGGELTVQVEKKDKQVFEATSDASFANGPERRSAEGYSFKLYSGLIDWAARKQATVSTSTTEAELLGMLHAGKQLIWWNRFFTSIGFDPQHDVVLHGDNTQTIRLLKSELGRIPTKLLHIDVAQCWLRQEVQEGRIDVAYLPTARMVSDGLTKLLSPQKHAHFINLLGLKDLTDDII